MKRSIFPLLFFLIFNGFASLAQDTTYQLPEFNINANRDYPAQTIQGLRLESIPNPQCDIGTLLRMMPNTSGIRRGGSAIDPVYRGFRNNQLLITTSEGIRIEGGCPNRMDPTTSHIDADDISLLRWESGSNMLLYGQAIGGVLVMETDQPQPFQKWTLKTQIKTGFESNTLGFSSNIKIQGGNKKVFFILSGGYKNYGNYTDGRDSAVNSSYQKDFFTAKIGVALTSKQHLIASYTRSESRDVRYPALSMDEKSDFTNLFNLSYLIFNNEKQEVFKINAYYTGVAHLMDNFHRPQASQIVAPATSIMRAESAVDAYTTGLNFQKKLKFNKLSAILGGDIHQINKDGTRTRNMIMTMNGLTTTSTKYDNLWNDAVIINTGIYGQFAYALPSLHSALTGTLRYDYHQHFSADTFNLVKNDVEYFTKNTVGNQMFSYGLRYDWDLSKTISVSIDAVSAQRSPNMNELYIKRMGVGFDNYDYLGNPNLKPETNHQVTLNFRAAIKDISLGVNLFASQVDDYIGAVLLPPSIITPATQGAPGVKQFSNLGSAHFYGGELVLNSSTKKHLEYGASAGYTYATLDHAIKYNIVNSQVVSQEIIDNDPLPEIPAMSTSAWVLYKISKWHLIPQLNIEYTLPQHAVSEANYESSTPDYMLINANISYTFKTWATLNLGANNLLNKAYYNHLNRRVVSSNPAEKIKLYEPGRVVYVSLKLEF